MISVIINVSLISTLDRYFIIIYYLIIHAIHENFLMLTLYANSPKNNQSILCSFLLFVLLLFSSHIFIIDVRLKSEWMILTDSQQWWKEEQQLITWFDVIFLSHVHCFCSRRHFLQKLLVVLLFSVKKSSLNIHQKWTFTS